jgi:hypothetical protein
MGKHKSDKERENERIQGDGERRPDKPPPDTREPKPGKHGR